MRDWRPWQAGALLVALAVGLVPGPGDLAAVYAQGREPKPTPAVPGPDANLAPAMPPATTGVEPRRRAAAKAKAKAKARAKAKAKRKAKRAGTSANMPKGFAWPPTAQMQAIGASCLEALVATGLEVEVAPKAQLEAQARVVTPVIIRAMRFGEVQWVPTFRKPPFVMDCHLALALHRVGPALVAAGVHTVHFSRIYEFSRVRAGGRKSRAISRHALGLAVDIRKVEGHEAQPDQASALPRLASVHADYHASAWLRAVEAAFNASGLFRTVLGPANDPRSHYDHFHVEAAASFAP